MAPPMRSRPQEPALYMWTPERIAEYLEIPVGLVHRFIASGLLEAREVEPGTYRVPRGALVKLVAQHPWLRAADRNPPGS